MKKRLSVQLALLALGTPTLVWASSFQLLEQSPAHMGKAFAGTASDIADATTVYFNPAGMTRLEGGHFTLGGNLVSTQAEFHPYGADFSSANGETNEDGFIPNAYLVLPLAEGFSLGLGAGGPFGLSSDFGTQWPGRYGATYSELEVMNINATVAWAPSELFSFGLGINFQRMEVTLENQVDSTLGANPDPTTDSRAHIKGDDDDYVLDASILFTPSRYTNIGLVWREGGEFNLQGQADFTLNTACSPGAGFPTGAPPAPTTGTLCAGALAMLQGEVAASVSLPDTITLSVSQWINDYWAIHADIAQTRWNSIQDIGVMNVENQILVDELRLRYDDTMRYALGTSLRTSSLTTWRLGLAFDEAPQTDPEFVTPRIPDQDRIWAAIGVNLKFSDALSLDISYAHLFVDDAHLNQTNSSGYHLQGHFENKVDIFAAQLNWRF